MNRNPVSPAEAPPRATRLLVAAVAQVLSGAIISAGALTQSFGPDGFEYTRWLLGLGVFGILSGLGLYLQLGLARATSFFFAAPTAILGLIALVFGAEGGSPLWQYFAIGLVTLCGIASLIATGQWRPVFEWSMRDD